MSGYPTGSRPPTVERRKGAHTSTADETAVIGGIDTHTDLHTDLHQAAVIDGIGRHLATERFETTPEGYRRLLDWLRSHGEVLAVGVEGTGAYGAEVDQDRAYDLVVSVAAGEMGDPALIGAVLRTL
ncbi:MULTISPECIES: transposase [unclassified Streptomyces]|uniref:IS110 family transposase n=1 Tax=unclassified Streptomyces TaxID=2593676 RepID=UPI00288034C5|nr:transposase [Streptomyces sp. I6]